MAEVDPAVSVSSGKLLPLVELRCKDRYVKIEIIRIDTAKWNCVSDEETFQVFKMRFTP